MNSTRNAPLTYKWPVNWSAKLTRTLTLKDGTKLVTLEDARRVVLAHLTTEVEAHALSNAMRLSVEGRGEG
jgi:hypothetical protein